VDPELTRSAATCVIHCGCVSCFCFVCGSADTLIAVIMMVFVVDKCGGQYRERRCITEQQCRAMRSVFGVVIGEKLEHEQLWKVRDDGVCHVSCPPTNYTDSLTDPHRCNKCIDTCHKGTFTVAYVWIIQLVFAVQQCLMNCCCHCVADTTVAVSSWSLPQMLAAKVTLLFCTRAAD